MQEKKKIGRPPPSWLINLQPGRYSLEEIVKISGKTKSPVRNTLKLHGAIATYQVKENGKSQAYYIWNGLTSSSQ